MSSSTPAPVDRRTLLGGFLLSMLATPLAVEAQPAGKVARIGYISNAPSTPLTESFWRAFVGGLREQGWTEHQNLVIERRYAELRERKRPARS
ncbi:MAG: hypothetical protein DMD99_23950 [Candidatus Rokuibacteriota bacterium]|nr:MAG: hypothetical protein DMD99_23950 [Candidatus Rokubacteria bacterium]